MGDCVMGDKVNGDKIKGNKIVYAAGPVKPEREPKVVSSRDRSVLTFIHIGA
jgi:hypothetical protein